MVCRGDPNHLWKRDDPPSRGSWNAIPNGVGGLSFRNLKFLGSLFFWQISACLIIMESFRGRDCCKTLGSMNGWFTYRSHREILQSGKSFEPFHLREIVFKMWKFSQGVDGFLYKSRCSSHKSWNGNHFEGDIELYGKFRGLPGFLWGISSKQQMLRR